MTDQIILRKPLEDLEAGDTIRFVEEDDTPIDEWFKVVAADQRYVIAQYHDGSYTVIDLEPREHTYNGVGPGIVRSSLNTLGGGYDTSAEGWADQMLVELNDGTWELSNRRLAAVHGVEVLGA